MERLTTLVEDVDVSFANALITLDNATRSRRFVAIDEAKAILDRWLPESAVAGIREWDVARLLEPYGDGTYHGKLLKRTRKQLRSVSSREALTVPFLFKPHLELGVSRSGRRRRGPPVPAAPPAAQPWVARFVILAVGVLLILGSLALYLERGSRRPMATIPLALAAAALYGLSDFAGGVVSRRASVWGVAS